MTTFEYTIIDLENVIHRGSVRAWTKRHANRQITQDGVTVVTVSRVQALDKFWRRLFRRISRIDRIVLFRNLVTTMRAGLNLTEALAATREQTTNPLVKRVIAEAESAVLSGQPFSTALGRYPKLFSPVTVSMIRLGERGGKLIESLDFLVNQQEGDYRLVRKIRNALVYPTLIIATMILIVTVMMIVVIPKIAQIYGDAGVNLPFYTAALIAVSHFLAHYGLYFAAGIVLLGLWFRFELRSSFSFRVFIHRIIIRLPIIGLVVKKLNLAMISRSLHMLIRAGVSLDESLVLAGGVASNEQYRRAMRAAQPFVRRGVGLSDIFKNNPELFLPLFQRMVMTGEETGKLDDMFSHISRYYDDDIQYWATNVSTLIEPILLLLTGVVVGSVAFAIIFPLWNLANVI